MVSAEDAELLRKNARDLGLSDTAFIKLCLVIGAHELKLKDEYTFKYSYLRWYKPKDLIKDLIGKEEKDTEKEVRKSEKEVRKAGKEARDMEEKREEQPQKGKIKIQL